LTLSLFFIVDGIYLYIFFDLVKTDITGWLIIGE
jgi:hypothetical protein